MENIKMPSYDRIDVFEGIDINKTSKWKGCDICHYWYFVKKAKEIFTFGDVEIETSKFYHYKSPIFLKDLYIEKVLVSNKISSGEKAYVKRHYGQTKWMYFWLKVITC